MARESIKSLHIDNPLAEITMNQTRYAIAALALLFTFALPTGDLHAQYGSCGIVTTANWGSSPLINYTMNGGVLISDPTGDQSPADIDIVVSTTDASAVAVGFNGTTAFFRMQLRDNPEKTTNGGFANNGSYLVQIANTAGVHLATVGVDAKGTDDFVFAQNPAGTIAATFFPYSTHGYTGMRAVPVTGSTTTYLEFQVPVCVLEYVSGGAITSTTPVKLYFGTSTSNAVVNKDFSTPGNTVDFSLMSTMSMHNVQIGVLPVELVSFTASLRNGDVHLRWHTATETNNFGFDVQRKSVPSDTWTSISLVAGHGTTSAPHDYAFVDRGITPGAWEYRLRQIDRDGSEHFSPILNVTGGSVAIGMQLLGTYPSPMRGDAVVRFSLSSDNVVTLLLTDLLGRPAAAALIDQVLPAGTHARSVNVGNLESGSYLLMLRAGDALTMQTVTVVR